MATTQKWLIMADWILVATRQECPSGSAMEVVAGDEVIALYNVEGEFHALDGVCPHQGGPLGKGTLTGSVVTCPWHGWQFDVTTGRHGISATISQPCYDVRLEGDEIYVRRREC